MFVFVVLFIQLGYTRSFLTCSPAAFKKGHLTGSHVPVQSVAGLMKDLCNDLFGTFRFLQISDFLSFPVNHLCVVFFFFFLHGNTLPVTFGNVSRRGSKRYVSAQSWNHYNTFKRLISSGNRGNATTLSPNRIVSYLFFVCLFPLTSMSSSVHIKEQISVLYWTVFCNPRRN